MIDLEDDYNVTIMDKNINMINIDKNSSINLTTKGLKAQIFWNII